MNSPAGPQSTLTPGASSFLERQLTVKFYLVTGQGVTETTFAGCRISATAELPGMGRGSSLNCVIFGLPLSFMNAASNLGTNTSRVLIGNKIRLTAGDVVNGFSQVFYGSILECYVDANGAPDVGLVVHSVSSLEYQLMSIPPTSIKGPAVPAAAVFQAIANQLNFKLVNSGVTATLANPYFHGSSWDQLQACAIAANVNLSEPYIMQGVIAIAPVGQYIGETGPTPLISASTGMIGYPNYASTGLQLRCIYNPAILFDGKVQVQSSFFPQANGFWKVGVMTHTLESNTPDGLWETEIVVQGRWSVPQ